jgi:iron complex transport system ATP-binding protein
MLLNAENVHASYGDRTVLCGVSLQLQAGEVVGLLGPNGAGKSTLLRALLGQISSTGNIVWDDRPLTEWKRQELARRVAYLPQTPSSPALQRVEDVLRTGRAPYWGAFGLESERDLNVVAEVAERLNLKGLLKRPMAELSGGQRQRVFVGRCLVQEPAALLLDEPSTFLDIRHQVELNQLIRKLATDQKIAVIAASHDLNLAGMFADRLILLNDGIVVRSGTPDTVLDAGALSDVYGMPIERIERPVGEPPIVIPKLAR